MMRRGYWARHAAMLAVAVLAHLVLLVGFSRVMFDSDIDRIAAAFAQRPPHPVLNLVKGDVTALESEITSINRDYATLTALLLKTQATMAAIDTDASGAWEWRRNQRRLLEVTAQCACRKGR